MDLKTIEKTKNKELRKQARESLSGRWCLAIGTIIIFFIITIGIGFIKPNILGSIASFLISGSMSVGLCYFSLAISRSDNPKLVLIFFGFKKFGTSLAAYILMGLFILLWALIGIIPCGIGFFLVYRTPDFLIGKLVILLGIICFIPAIIAAYSYAQTYFIIADNQIGPFSAICRSIKIMKGNKWKFFWLNISFIWWVLLSLITFCIGFLWVVPYMIISMAKFYEDIKDRN
ncbi:MAG: DUF975 family protein [bacterium]|nr:DUF975 family protein [bacterium]